MIIIIKKSWIFMNTGLDYFYRERETSKYRPSILWKKLEEAVASFPVECSSGIVSGFKSASPNNAAKLKG